MNRFLRKLLPTSIPLTLILLIVINATPFGTSQDRGGEGPRNTKPEERRRLLEEKNRRHDEAMATWRALKFDEAILQFEELIVLEKKILGENHWEVAGSYFSLAEILEMKGDFAGARKYLLEVYKIALTYGSEGWRFVDACFYLEDLERRQSMTDEEKTLMTEVKMRQKRVRKLYDHEAAPLMAKQAISEVKKILEIKRKVLGTRHRDYAQSLHELGLLNERAANYSDAEKYHRAALELRKVILGANHPRYAESLGNLAQIYHLTGRYVDSFPLYEESFDIFVEWGMQGDDQGREDLEIALNSLKDSLLVAFSSFSELEQLVLIARLRSTLNAYLSVARVNGYPGEAVYGHAFPWKGSVLSRQRRIRIMRGRPAVNQLLNELQEVTSAISAIALPNNDGSMRDESTRRVKEFEERRKRLEQRLGEESRELIIHGKVFGQFTLEQVRESIPDHAVLLDYLVYDHFVDPRSEGREWSRKNLRKEQRLSVFVMHRSGPIDWVDLGPVAPIEKEVDKWRRSLVGASPRGTQLHDPSTGLSRESARRIKRFLWEPLEKHIADSDLVIVSPDGPVSWIPMGALPGSKKDTYLLEEQSIVLVAVPWLLPELSRTSGSRARRPGFKAKSSLLVVGDVDFDGLPWNADDPVTSEAVVLRSTAATSVRGESMLKIANWKEMKGMKEEIQEVEKIFGEAMGGERVTRLDRRRATEGALKRSVAEKNYIHLATHGFFASPELTSTTTPLPDAGDMRKNSPTIHPGLLSGIVLAGANRRDLIGLEDGILTALELASLDLTAAELIVLSACETGLGVTAAGEGLLGLLRAGQIAGCQTVIGSLWKVNDRATKALMIRFYDNLWNKGMSKIEALRDAQLALLRGEIGRSEGDNRGTRLAGTGWNKAAPKDWAAWVLSGDWR